LRNLFSRKLPRVPKPLGIAERKMYPLRVRPSGGRASRQATSFSPLRWSNTIHLQGLDMSQVGGGRVKVSLNDMMYLQLCCRIWVCTKDIKNEFNIPNMQNI